EETMIALLGKNGQLLSPQQIYDHLELVDWDDYRKIIEKVQSKGILVNAISEQKKTSLAKNRNVSKRDIKRLKVRTPLECEEGLKRLFEVLKSLGYVAKLSSDYINNIHKKIGKSGVYAFRNSTDLKKSLRALNLIDNANAPTTILRAVWGEVIKKKVLVPTNPASPRVRDIYIENIDYSCTETELLALFEKFGTV